MNPNKLNTGRIVAEIRHLDSMIKSHNSNWNGSWGHVRGEAALMIKLPFLDCCIWTNLDGTKVKFPDHSTEALMVDRTERECYSNLRGQPALQNLDWGLRNMKINERLNRK